MGLCSQEFVLKDRMSVTGHSSAANSSMRCMLWTSGGVTGYLDVCITEGTDESCLLVQTCVCVFGCLWKVPSLLPQNILMSHCTTQCIVIVLKCLCKQNTASILWEI